MDTCGGVVHKTTVEPVRAIAADSTLARTSGVVCGAGAKGDNSIDNALRGSVVNFSKARSGE